MKPIRIIIAAGTLVLAQGNPVQAEGLKPTGLGIGLQRRLLIKAGESLVDSVTRKVVEWTATPEGHEAYNLVGRPWTYQDEIFGTYRGSPMGYRVRRTWTDPMSGSVYYETWVDGVRQSTDPFFYVTHNRNFTCFVPGPAGYDLNIRAKVYYLVENLVTRVDLAHAVWSHPVRWELELKRLPADCQEDVGGQELTQFGELNLPRGGRQLVSPFLENVDSFNCTVTYGEK